MTTLMKKCNRKKENNNRLGLGLNKHTYLTRALRSVHNGLMRRDINVSYDKSSITFLSFRTLAVTLSLNNKEEEDDDAVAGSSLAFAALLPSTT